MANRPNILWLMTDEQRTDSLGCYESPGARTPHLDSLAETGVLFTRAVTPAPVCVPARTALLSGEYPCATGVWWNERRLAHLDYLTGAFAQAGYRTASVGKQHYGSRNQAFQTERNMAMTGRVHPFYYADAYPAGDYAVVQYPPEPYPWILGGRFPGAVRDTAEAQIVERALGWLDAHDPAEPFLLRVSFNGPHTPVVPPAPFDVCMGECEWPAFAWDERDRAHQPSWVRDSLRAFSDSNRLSAEQLRAARRYYYGYVSFIDSQCGVLLNEMEKRGLLEDTIIVFLSDHGTHLGDHGLVQKQTFYDPVVNVPFILSYPRRFQAGRRVRTPVETRSLLPTLLDFLDLPRRSGADSLLPTLLTGEEPDERPVFSEFTLGSFDVRHDDPLVMIRDGKWKLSLCLNAEGGDGSLHDLDADPSEAVNLFDDPRHLGVREELRAKILEHHRRHTP